MLNSRAKYRIKKNHDRRVRRRTKSGRNLDDLIRRTVRRTMNAAAEILFSTAEVMNRHYAMSDVHLGSKNTRASDPTELQLVTRFLVGYGPAELWPDLEPVIMGGDIVHTLKPK